MRRDKQVLPLVRLFFPVCVLCPVLASAADYRVYVPFALRETGATSDVAYQDKFSSEIVLMNVGNALASVHADFYTFGSHVADPVVDLTINAKGRKTLLLSSLFETTSFAGSVVITSSQPLAGVVLQKPGRSSLRPSPTTRAFSSRGENRVYLSTVLKDKFDSTTRFAVQNTSDRAATFTLSIYDAADQQRKYVGERSSVIPGASRHFDMGRLSIPGFTGSGSAVIESTGTIVASAMELDTRNQRAKGFEGESRGGRRVHMATALCRAFSETTTYYAVQNTSMVDFATVRVDYSNGVTDSLTIEPGAKGSIDPCRSGAGAGFSGAAQMTVVDGKANIVAMGKAVDPFSNPTAFHGVTLGGRRVALPYVRWSTASSGPRTYIAIQNLSGVTQAAKITFYNPGGSRHGSTRSLTIGSLQKRSVSLGTYENVDFNGTVLINGPEGASFNVVARTNGDDDTSLVPREDYNGVVVLGELGKTIDISQGTGPITVDDVRCWVESAGVKQIVVKAAIDDEWSGSNHNRDTSRQQLESLWRAREEEGLNFMVGTYLYVHWPPNLNFSTPVPDQVRESISILDELAVDGPPLSVNRLWIDVEEAPPSYQSISTTNKLIQQALDACGSFPCGIYTRASWWSPYTGNTTAFSNYPIWYAYYDRIASFADWPTSSFGGFAEPAGKQYDNGNVLGKICGKSVDWNIMYQLMP